MAMVNFKKGLLANLPTSYAAGTFYVTTDERAMYLDVDDSTRIRLGDFQEFATLEALKANTNPSTSALYYVTNINCLAKWTGIDYIQINLDTGATSVEVVGDGNAVTAASYDPATRKLTLTKGATYTTASDVSGAISLAIGDFTGYDNVKAYIDAKTEGVATDAALGELQGKVEQAEADIDALEEKVGDSKVSDQIDAKITALDLANTYEAKGEAAKVQGKLDEEVARAKLAEETNATAAKAADDKAVAAQGDIDALELKVGEVPADKTVVQMISDAQTAATYDDTKVKEDIKANADAIALLNNGSTVEGSVDYKIAQAVAAIIENPDETMNSINELVTWCNDHAADALELSNKVSANEGDIAALEGLVGETAVATQIESAIAAALKIEGVDKYALASNLTAAIARIAAMEAKVANWDAAEKNAKDYADGLNTAMNTRVEALEAIDHEHANAAELDKIADGDVAKWNAAQANAEATAAAALSGAKTELEGKISGGDAQALADAKAYADGLAGNYDATGSAAQALTDAKAYTDGALEWGSF